MVEERSVGQDGDWTKMASKTSRFRRRQSLHHCQRLPTLDSQCKKDSASRIPSDRRRREQTLQHPLPTAKRSSLLEAWGLLLASRQKQPNGLLAQTNPQRSG